MNYIHFDFTFQPWSSSDLELRIPHRHDVEVVVVAKRFEDRLRRLFGNLVTLSQHRAGHVQHDEHVLRIGGRVDVPECDRNEGQSGWSEKGVEHLPLSVATVEQVEVLHVVVPEP